MRVENNEELRQQINAAMDKSIDVFFQGLGDIDASDKDIIAAMHDEGYNSLAVEYEEWIKEGEGEAKA